MLPFVWGELGLIFSSGNIFYTLFFLGLITFVAAILNFQAYKKGKISVVEPVLELELPITIALGILFLSEKISLYQFLLSLSILGGIFLISSPKISARLRSFSIEKGVMLAIFAAFFMALVNIFTATASRVSSPLLAIWTAWAIFGSICFAYILLSGKFRNMAYNARKYPKLIAGEAIFDTVAWVLYAVAMVSLPVSIVTAITESYPAITILLGLIISKETIFSHQKLGVGLTLLSTLLLSLSIA